jgi:hypothetical protein
VSSWAERPDSSVTALVNRAVVKCRELAGTSSRVTAPSVALDRLRPARPKPAEITLLSVCHTVL